MIILDFDFARRDCLFSPAEDRDSVRTKLPFCHVTCAHGVSRLVRTDLDRRLSPHYESQLFPTLQFSAEHMLNTMHRRIWYQQPGVQGINNDCNAAEEEP